MRALDKALSSSHRKERWATLAFTGVLIIGTLAAIATLLGVRPQAHSSIQQAPTRSVVGKPEQQPPIVTEKPDAQLSPKSDAPVRSRELTRLVELRAYSIWDQSGRPQGHAGEAVKERNWIEAERQVGSEVNARAYKIWLRQGSPVGAAGEAVSEANRHAAESELLREIEKDSHNPSR
jgi:Protein of unknown function (DUF2934)